MLSRERLKYVESKEGFTYISKSMEQTASARLLNFVPEREALKW